MSRRRKRIVIISTTILIIMVVGLVILNQRTSYRPKLGKYFDDTGVFPVSLQATDRDARLELLNNKQCVLSDDKHSLTYQYVIKKRFLKPNLIEVNADEKKILLEIESDKRIKVITTYMDCKGGTRLVNRNAVMLPN